MLWAEDAPPAPGVSAVIPVSRAGPSCIDVSGDAAFGSGSPFQQVLGGWGVFDVPAFWALWPGTRDSDGVDSEFSEGGTPWN